MCVYFQERGTAIFLPALDGTNGFALACHHGAADQVRLIILAIRQDGALVARDFDVGAGELLSVRDGFDTLKFEHHAITVPPDILDLILDAVHEDATDSLGIFAQRYARQLAFVTARAKKFSDSDKGGLQNLFEYFEREPPVEFHTGGAEKCPDGARRTSLLSYDFPKIGGRHPQFQNSDLFPLNFADSDLFRDVHEGFCNLFDEFSHGSVQAAGASSGVGAGFLFRRRVTVSDGCAPFLSQYSTRSCFSVITWGRLIGL